MSRACVIVTLSANIHETPSRSFVHKLYRITQRDIGMSLAILWYIADVMPGACVIMSGNRAVKDFEVIPLINDEIWIAV